MELLLLLMFVPKVGLMFPDVGCREDAGDELVVAEQQLLGCKRVSVNFFLFCILVFFYLKNSIWHLSLTSLFLST